MFKNLETCPASHQVRRLYAVYFYVISVNLIAFYHHEARTLCSVCTVPFLFPEGTHFMNYLFFIFKIRTSNGIFRATESKSEGVRRRPHVPDVQVP